MTIFLREGQSGKASRSHIFDLVSQSLVVSICSSLRSGDEAKSKRPDPFDWKKNQHPDISEDLCYIRG